MDVIKLSKFKADAVDWVRYALRQRPFKIETRGEDRRVVVMSEDHYQALIDNQKPSGGYQPTALT